MTPQKSRRDPMNPVQMTTLKHWGEPPGHVDDSTVSDVTMDCGWGRLIFGQTFSSPERLADELRREEEGRRDVALYVRDPHVVIAMAPQYLFLDPSHTYRLALQTSRLAPSLAGNVHVRRAQPPDEAATNRIYRACHMVPVREGFLESVARQPALVLLVAEDVASGDVLGAVTGVDHVRACRDPDRGASLWSLAVDPQGTHPGIGEALVRALVAHFRAEGRTYLDLSVMYNNAHAIALYEKLGFERVPVYCVKNKNPINERLFVGPDSATGLNIYARILVDEARRRGIGVEVLDAEHGYFRLSHGGRSITCRESLSDMTSAVAMSRCDDKRVTRNVLTGVGLHVPEQQLADSDERVAAFLRRHGRVVVKPVRGEQGHGVRVDLRRLDEVKTAIQAARRYCDEVIIEALVTGHDLRIIVIDYRVVAAATRRPAEVTGDGQNNIRMLISKQSRRREAATSGESSIPVDEETERCVRAAGYNMNGVLPSGTTLPVRKTANLHTGGTIHDVTDQVHPVVREAAEHAAHALEIPVVGLDLIVPDLAGEKYSIIEANERPGLANHEPQPTAERFIDLLFPQTKPIMSSS